MIILLGSFNANIGREDIFEPTIGNESLHKISNDNGVRVVNIVTSKVLLPKVRCSNVVKFINSLRHILKERLTTKLTIF
jgi:hypothetical protein